MAKVKHTFSATASYAATGKEYKPRAAHNVHSWAKLQAALPCKGSVLATALVNSGSLAALVKEHGGKVAKIAPKGKPQSVAGFRASHADFIGYLVGGGYLKAS